MAVNKVVYNGTALVDFTADTVTADVLQSGYTAHQADGELITGTAAPASNLNLLDNWYFADPINQRGKTSYTSGYTIDRWRILNGALSLNSAGEVEKVQNADSSVYRYCFFQLIENPQNYLGKEITFSILYKGLNGAAHASVYWDGGGTNIVGGSNSSSDGIMSVTATIPQNITPTEFKVQALVSQGGSFTPIAAKLELGPTQTLAHKEGDAWVLNDPPPNKALELAKCQRYCIIFNAPASGTRVCGTSIAHNNSNAFIVINTPVTLVKNAAPVYSNLKATGIFSDGYASKNITLSIWGVVPNGMQYVMAESGKSFIPGNSYKLEIMPNSSFEMNSNL